MKTIRMRIAASSASPRMFKKMVASTDKGVTNGDIVRIVDRNDEFVGQGFYNNKSEIAVRLLTRSSRETVDDEWIRRRVYDAVRLRRDVLRLDRVTDAYRVFHAEADGLPGLIVDRYGDLLSVEVSVLGTFLRMVDIKDALKAALSYRAIAVRDEPRISKKEGFRIPPFSPGPEWRCSMREHGARFHVDLAGGHKTGFFLDQRDTRRIFAEYCGGRRVLDLCCHAGGFGIQAALVGKASQVRCVDLDEAAVALARANAKLNGIEAEVVHADAFDELRGVKEGAFDALVLDPPKLVRSRGERTRGLNRYLDLNVLALKALKPGAIFLTCSCSGLIDEPTFLEIVRRAVRATGKGLRILRIAGASPDHPVNPEVPESRYLKTILAEVV
jgi:23S rRNA (cytosine1962-C5)-methyltransferase